MGELVYTLDESLPIVDAEWSPTDAADRVETWSAANPGEATRLYLYTDDGTGDMHGLVGDIVDGEPAIVQAALDSAADGLPVELQDRTRGSVKALTALGAARSANKARILQGQAPVIGGEKVSAAAFKAATGESTSSIRKAAIGEAGSKSRAATEARAQAAKSKKRASAAAKAVHGKPGARVQPRSDAEQDSMMVSLPVPPDVAAQWPDMGGNGAPPITLVYIGPGSEVEFERVLKIVDKHAPAMIGQTVGLGGVDYFDEPRSQPDKRCAYAAVDVTDACASTRHQMDADMRADGIEPVRYGDGEWVPHATLSYLAKGETYSGAVPTGQWQIDGVDVHRNGEVVRMYGNGRMDRLAQRDGKWIALSADGKTEFGTYDTEAEARERLRQVEAAKAATAERADAQAERLLGRAPAVHTESRAHTFDIVRADKADMGQLIQQANGWRQYHVKYSRYGNVQPYVEHGRTVYEYRDPKAVKDPVSLESGRGVPWELRHSRDLLKPESVLGRAQGSTLTFELDDDGEHTSGIAKAWGRDLFDAIDDGMKQVSMAYGATVDRRPGTTDDGVRFDQRQVRVLINSMATEPRGNAGTAEIVGPPRFDAANVITRADALLAIARADAAPTHPVFYDLRGWRTERTTTTTRKDQEMNLIKALLQAAGKSPADLASMLGVEEAGLEAALADEMNMKKAVAFVTGQEPVADGGMPGEPAPSDMAKVMVGDKDYEVPAAVAQRIAELEGTADMATKRADAAEQAKRLAYQAKATAEAEAKKRQDAAADMVSRADADRLALEQGLVHGRVIELARRGLGWDFNPEPRQDAETGATLPVSIWDWQCAALRGAFGDEAANALIARLDGKTPEGRAAIIEEKLIEVEGILTERQDTVVDVTASIARNRANAAAANRARQDANTDVIAAAIEQNRKFHSTTTPAKATGA